MGYDYIDGMLNSFFSEEARKCGINVKSVLEIGCGRGEFVQHLRERGIEAYGIDIAPRTESKHIIKGDARNLEEYFGKNKFDVIAANGVLCSGGQLEALTFFNYKEAKEQFESNFNEFAKEIHQNCIAILKSCFEQLNAPGYFLNQETNTEYDRIIYTKKDAKKIGFRVEGYNPFCAVLAKKR